ncbi:Protein of unknown function (DUF1358) [Popillia japonica]|uniref:Transmembrane protein 242 n=1 Tax=Popillia japonica TaxID=7064 RepID=A0AAW1IAA9_POPJA
MGDKQVVVTEDKLSDSTKLKAGIFLSVVSGISALVGFSATLAAAKKQDAKYFDKGIMSTTHTQSGTGILVYGIWKFSGAKNFEEFRCKIGLVLPKITKETPGERTEFDGLTDLLNYIQTRD